MIDTNTQEFLTQDEVDHLLLGVGCTPKKSDLEKLIEWSKLMADDHRERAKELTHKAEAYEVCWNQALDLLQRKK